ncbi:MAG: FAD-dependent oxidoreductase [Bacteroidales bacterium]|nr:FAD-dependent oxidoreductase [Bacteroidales bacterium]
MDRKADFIFFPEQIFSRDSVLKEIATKFDLRVEDIEDYKILRRSVDARKLVKYNIRLQFILKGEKFTDEKINFNFKNVQKLNEIIIIGAGPAGYFAALACLQKGLKPIVVERGKSIDERKHDIALINREHIINAESNYAFGEGGAGTYSDGKLYTRSKKRGDNLEVLQLLNYFGASDDILIDAHPHIGTDKLPSIMKNIRTKIIECGGEVHFNTKIIDFGIENNSIKSLICEDGREFVANNVILATGHSARDIYYILHERNVKLQGKGFAMGVRVEHPQDLIDSIQYKCEERGKYLPAATYNIVTQVQGRGVYSFCMCPGGTIVSAATDKDQIVVNGMSNSRRNSPFANSGIIVELRPEDFSNYSENKVFSGLEFQKTLEQMSYQNSASGLRAPAQRLSDFVKGRISNGLPESSYYPGLINSPLHFWLPEIISSKLKIAFKEFDKRMKGFVTNEAIVVGVESRTSSPIQIIRDNETLESVSIRGLYPCGEGAGYAGGIVSSAIDGLQIVERIAAKKLSTNKLGHL